MKLTSYILSLTNLTDLLTRLPDSVGHWLPSEPFAEADTPMRAWEPRSVGVTCSGPTPHPSVSQILEPIGKHRVSTSYVGEITVNH